MDLWEIIKVILAPIALMYIGFNERDRAQMKKKISEMKEDISDIDTQIQLVRTENRIINGELKEGVDRVEKKVDKLLERELSKNK